MVLDAPKLRIDVDYPKPVDLRKIYSAVKDAYRFVDDLICWDFPFTYVGDNLLLREGWTMRINDKVHQEAGIMIYQQDWI